MLPLAVTAVLGGGTGTAVWVDRAAPADAASAPGVTDVAAGRLAEAAGPDASARATRPNRDSGRPPLPAAAATAASSASSSAAPKPSASAAARTAKPTAKPGVLGATATLGDVIGRRYLRDDVTLRLGPGKSYAVSGSLDDGDRVGVTDRRASGWTQISWSGKARWVPTRQLTATNPNPPAPKRTATPSARTSTGSSSSAVSGASCRSGNAVERGLTPDAVKVHRAICAAFPQVSSFGGVRADSLPEHPSGRAIDAMISDSTVGWRIATWVRAHARELGVSQVIYSQKIWTVQRSAEGWRSMSDRGSATANHYDHVHVTVYGSAATG